MLLLAATYVVPLAVLAVTYTRVGVELWGSKSIGERTAGQDETLKSKRKVPQPTVACKVDQQATYGVAEIAGVDITGVENEGGQCRVTVH